MNQARPLIITRPLPGGEASLHRARDMGIEAHLVPLFAAQALDWAHDDADIYDGLLLTSAQAPRLGGGGLAHVRNLPCYAVGEATAVAARAAGLNVVMVGDADGQSLIDAMTDKQGTRKQRILWLCGREHSALAAGTATLIARPCYAVDPVEPPSRWHQMISAPAVMMAHSPRAAAHMATLAGQSRVHLSLVAISAAAAAAAGEGWNGCFAALQPNDAAMLALACALCHKDGK